MAATFIIKPSPYFFTPPPPSLPYLPYASSFRLWTPFFRGGRGLFSSPFHNHDHTPPSSLTVFSAISTPDRTDRFDSHESEPDQISTFNDSILKEQFTKRNSGRYYSESNSGTAGVTDEEVDKYIQLVKLQQQRGLRELKKGHLQRTTGGSVNNNNNNNNNVDAGFSYKVAFSLKEGDYVVHKKVGTGRFMSIRPSIPDGEIVPIDYVYIQYADGVAKIPVKQESKFLYRYNLPNESGAPRGLGRLKDTRVWEKRKIKGKVAIQKMVVDLMEVYLNRLRLRRPTYPKNPAKAEFTAQFSYDPTPDQKEKHQWID